MLPPDFRWRSVGTAPFEQPNSLQISSIEVARLYKRINDHTWCISLNNQRELKLRKQKLCSGYEQGKAGPEIWAERHQDRLRTEVDGYLQGLQAERARRTR